MRRAIARLVLLLIVLAGPTAPALAKHASQHETVNGLDIYIGLLPGTMVERFPQGGEERRMHGGPAGGERRYHLVVAVFENTTGRRIEHADVRARVAELGLVAKERSLQPMKVQGAATYGRFFDMRASGRYAITVTVRPSHRAPPVQAEFVVSIE